MTALPNIPPDAQRQFAPHMGATTVEVPTNQPRGHGPPPR